MAASDQHLQAFQSFEMSLGLAEHRFAVGCTSCYQRCTLRGFKTALFDAVVQAIDGIGMQSLALLSHRGIQHSTEQHGEGTIEGLR